MRVLLLSDTHGNIDIINSITLRENVDACIHAGDFGFYNENSVASLNTKELRLQIKHFSAMPWENRKNLLEHSSAEQQKIILQHKMLGNFSEYLHGIKELNVPVYAVWGNHEDQAVILQLLKKPIKNLILIHESTQVTLEKFCLFGLGGNFVQNQTLIQPYQGIPGTKCRIGSALLQYQRLIEMTDAIDPEYKRILLTHVSPEYEPLAELLAWRTGACLTISGHMGFPAGSEWQTHQGDDARILKTLTDIKEKFTKSAGMFDVFKPKHPLVSIQHLNLPDAHRGYAVLELTGSLFQYSMRNEV